MNAIIDGTVFPRTYQSNAHAFLTAVPEIVGRVARRSILIAAERLLDDKRETFRVETDDHGDVVRFLIAGAPQIGWFDPADWQDCELALMALGRRPTDFDHSSAAWACCGGSHPVIILSLLGGDPRNSQVRAIDTAGREMVLLPDGNSVPLPPEGWPLFVSGVEAVAAITDATSLTNAWVFPVSRTVAVEDVDQIGLRLTDAARVRCEALFSNRIRGVTASRIEYPG